MRRSSSRAAAAATLRRLDADGSEALRQRVELLSSERIWCWRALPSAAGWVGATAAWFAVGLTGRSAVRRRRE